MSSLDGSLHARLDQSTKAGIDDIVDVQTIQFTNIICTDLRACERYGDRYPGSPPCTDLIVNGGGSCI